MSETMPASLANIRPTEDMIVAFRDQEQCRRLLESMAGRRGEFCPACGYKRSIAIAGRDRHWQAACASGSLSVFQRRLPVPVRGDDLHASAFHQTTFESLAEGQCG
jgi:ribosomal protein L37E